MADYERPPTVPLTPEAIATMRQMRVASERGQREALSAALLEHVPEAHRPLVERHGEWGRMMLRVGWAAVQSRVVLLAAEDLESNAYINRARRLDATLRDRDLMPADLGPEGVKELEKELRRVVQTLGLDRCDVCQGRMRPKRTYPNGTVIECRRCGRRKPLEESNAAAYKAAEERAKGTPDVVS